MVWIRAITAILAAYVLGAIPVGYVAAKLFKGVDIRQVGSGRTGASNVLRAAGVLPAALTVLGDFGKGYAGVAIAQALAPELPLTAALAGMASVAGHNWSVFMGFDGGVGTMTTAGAMCALSPIVAGGAIVLGAAVLFISRFSSLASITFSALLVIACVAGALTEWLPATHVVFAVGTGLMSVWELRPNIERLRQGTERKLGQFIAPGHNDVAHEHK